MKHRTLGKTGFRVSEIGLGCWQLGNDFGPVSDEQAHAVLGAAEAADIDFWDTADVYGDGLSEMRIGAHLTDRTARPIVATKVGRAADLYPDGYTREAVRSSVEGSARRLGVDQIDLLQLHCVPTDVLARGEVLSWMDELVDDGLIRHFGASVETIEEAHIAMRHPGLASLQIIFSLLRQDAITELFPAALSYEVGIIVRLPLASGVLSGKMTKDQQFSEADHRNYNRDGQAFSVGETFSGIPFERAVDLADQLARHAPDGITPAQFALRWVLDHPAVSTVIAGASRPEQVFENAAVSDVPTLPSALHAELAEFYRSEVRPHIRGVM